MLTIHLPFLSLNIISENLLDSYNVVYVPRQGSDLFTKKIFFIIPIIHEFFIRIDSKFSSIFNKRRPSPGFFERFYWLIWIICLRPSLVIGFEPSQELCWICKFFKIPSVDIEHGIRSFNPISGSYFYRHSYRYQNSTFPSYLLTTFNEEIHSSCFFNNLKSKRP